MGRYLLAALAAMILSLPTAAPAAVYTVTKLADTNDGVCDADCSLREAVAAAVASPEDDVIEFDPVLFNTPQTIVLSGTEIAIAANGTLTIQGPGADLLTISGASNSRIITNLGGATTTINDLSFTGGNGVSATNSGRGGAIYNTGGVLTLNRLVVHGNTAANGGGLNNATAGVLTINDTLVSGNSATGSGGGIQNFSTSTLTVTNSAFVGNSSGGATGGGAAQLNGLANISNSTFSGNTSQAGGTIQSNGALLLLTNVTLTGNTSVTHAGGLHRPTTNVNGYLRNTLIAGNTGVAGSPDVTNTPGGITSEGNNLIGVVGTSSGWQASDLLDQAAMLGALADNGGATPTHALLEGSPAIDAGNGCVLNQSCGVNNAAIAIDVDQRGLPRPAGAGVDIGAYELQVVDDDLIFADGFENG